MAETPRLSPLADVAVAARGVAGPMPVTLSALPFTGKLILRGDAEAAAKLKRPLGFALPETLASAGKGDVRAFWLGPDEWLLLVPAAQTAEVAERLRKALAKLHHALVEVSDRLHGIGVEGRRARDVLAAGIALDLHPGSFTPGMVARTLLGKATVILHRPGDGDRFELYLNGSFAPYAWRFLENAAREHGFKIAA